MKKVSAFLVMLCMAMTLFAAHVSQQDARQVAILFYLQYGMGNSGNPEVEDVIVTRYQDLTTYYTFLFHQGGFVIVAADDASIPVLGYSFESTMPRIVTNPATKEWLEGYSHEIFQIITHKLSNRETVRQWNAIRNGTFPPPTRDVNPLLTTTWDQGCFYNALCPADPSAGWSCGHVYTGCVATAMAQIMKYHDFPPQGVGSHSYIHPTYGEQSADFGATTYNWSGMPNNVTANNTPVATLMYHAGVSVDMQYGVDGSGAYSYDVPYALLNYFNYQPGVEIQYKASYSNVEDWKNLLRSDLDDQLPVYYSGYGSAGHAFVCDGYRMSDSKFHFNWGWSGSSNGWYAIGSLNPGGNNFNQDNAAVVHIKPYNPDLIVRIDHPVDNAVTGVGYPVSIEAVTVRGTPAQMKLFIDNVEKFAVNNDTLLFTWYTTSTDLGSHEVKAFAYTATDTVYYRINLNVAEWISQASGFTAASRGINYMWAADSNVVWATAFDNSNPTGPCSDFTRTTNGGTLWTPGTVTNTQGLASAMIFAMDSGKAYIPMYRSTGSKPQGIYFTSDGGTTWTRQTSALFSNSASFPNCVHFFNATDGWCMGDPISGEFEIYTTTDGGTTWTQVSGSNIPNPVSGEFGIVGYYSAVNDTIWYGTNKGRVYRSADKGYTWSVYTVPALNGKYIKPTFRNGSHGLVQDKDAGTTGAISETFDGGVTWNPVTTTGPIYPTDLAYIPGTENTWVSTGSTGTNGTSYSFDGGHTWTDFTGTQGAAYMQMTWINNHIGWAGGLNASATENGVYKYIGLLMLPLPPPGNLQATVNIHDVHLTWDAPLGDGITATLVGYNMYRDGTKLNTSTITDLVYDDLNVQSGQYTYCVKALYNYGESGSICEVVDVAVSMTDLSANRLMVYPNPVKTVLNILSGRLIQDIGLFNVTGQEVFQSGQTSGQIQINVSRFKPGIYTLKITTQEGISVMKIVIQ